MMDLVGYLLVLMYGLCWSVVYAAPSRQTLPICRSNDNLCRVSFEMDLGFGMTFPASASDICACPQELGSCSSADEPDSAQMHVMSQGQSFIVKMSYCGQQPVQRPTCQKGQVAAVFRGSGPFSFVMDGPLRCWCPGPLYLSSARPGTNGAIRQYTCGQSTCKVNSSKPPVCERKLLSEFPGEFVSEIPCQCPDDFRCQSDMGSVFWHAASTGAEDFHCQPITFR